MFVGHSRFRIVLNPWTRSMQVVLPVPWYSVGRAGCGLVEGMMHRRGELRPREEPLTFVVPEPVFTRLEALDSWVPAPTGVGACVLARGTVATSDVSARRTPAEVEPPPVGCQALRATSTAGLGLGVDGLIGHNPRLQ